jgi:hypothetical protein
MIRRMMQTFRQRWMHFFFEPVEPRNLGLCRVLFFGAFFLFYLPKDFSVWSEVSDAFWQPIVLFRVLHLPLLSNDVITILQYIWKVSLALSCLGLFTRASTTSSLILGVYLLGLPNNFGKLFLNETIVVFAFGLMALSRCGDAFSIDRLIWKSRQESNLTVRRSRMSGEYTWPVRTIWVLFALIFFTAGVTKLRISGLEWVFSDHLALSLIEAPYHIHNANPLVSWGLTLAQYSWLTILFAAGTIVLELSYPLALFSTRARWVIVPSVFFMLIGIRLLLGPTFYAYLICHLFWVPWDRVSYQLVKGFRELSPRKYLHARFDR